ncbi:MAG TPA: molybdopterin molybdotransferase MoeA, partial [Thermoanaerobaculia bacterium]|nr:molybdopterin molybdotransferase MoeA [Thermoanaerobaculia bacterium]
EVFRKGHVVLRAGERLEPGAVLLAATAGADPVDVVRLPRVVVAATGAEIVDAGSAPSPGQVRNGNGPALAAALARRGIPAVSVAAVPDDLDRLSGFFGASLDADLVLTTGGVSAGDYDLTLDAAVRAGFTVLFHRVAVKPGKPIAFGRRGGAFWFGLPGNPVSALTTFAIFVEAALDRFEGIRRERFVVAKLESPLRAKAGRESYRDAVLSVRDGDLLVSALPTRGSHDVRSQAGRNALLVVPAEGGEWKSGDPMRCLPLAGGPFVRS